MNKKMFWGLVIVVLSLFQFIPEEIQKYIFNYQVILILLGIYFVFKKKVLGWVLTGVGIYSYLSLIWEDLPFWILLLIAGLVIFGLGVKEIVDKRNFNKFPKKSKPKKVEEAEEIEEAEGIQGTQYEKMGEVLYSSVSCENKKIIDEIFENNEEVKKVVFEGTKDELKDTKFAQPAIALFSVILTKLLKEKGINPDFVAGHSLGEYSSLYAAGFLNEIDTLKLISARGKIMSEAKIDGSMAAILGLPANEVENICCEIDGVIEAVNYNEPKQTVVAGEKAAIEKSLEIFKEKGARRALPLAVSGPFHSSLMKPVAEVLKKEFENYSWSDAKTPIVAHTTANILTSSDEIKTELYNQTFGPVKWVDTINKLSENGVTKIYEVGPGKVLAGLIKKINKEIEVINIENVENIENI